ncbi:hypothetical protein AAHC03_04785 [Spirometra sp. Aus1]
MQNRHYAIFAAKIVCLLWIYATTTVRSLPNRRTSEDVKISSAEATKRLYRYGYINPPASQRQGNPIPDTRYVFSRKPHPESLELPTEELYQAIKTFQLYFSLPVTGQLDLETRRLLATPRCGNPDNTRNIPRVRKSRKRTNHRWGGLLKRQKRYLVGDDKMHWSKKKVTWQIRSYPTHSLNRSRTHVVFQHAFNKWARVADLDFEEEKDYSRDADIVIQFGSRRHGDSIAFDGPGGVLAHAFYPVPEPVYSLAGDAHFDDDETWSDGPRQDHRNLLSVAVHELGHSMGLGHSDVPTSVMFPYYLSKWSQVELDKDDIDGMQRIYGPPRPGKVLPPEPSLPDIPPPPAPTTASPDKRPLFDYCNISIDAIIEIRGLELYVFKGPMQWRVTWSKTVSTWVSYQFRDGPAKIAYYWNVLPESVDHVDAAIERSDSKIYIFMDDRFWLLLDNKHMVRGFPLQGLPLTYLGLPEHLKKVDTVFRWDANKEIYIFAGEHYWLLNPAAGRYGKVIGSPDYPRLIKHTWRGIPTPVTAAFTTLNGETLFFIGSDYYVFDNIAMKARNGYPKPARLGILGCMDP